MSVACAFCMGEFRHLNINLSEADTRLQMIHGLLLKWITQYGYVGLVSLLFLGILGIPVPDEALLTFSGFLVSKGDLRLVPTIASGFLGSSCGITVSYGIGRIFGVLFVKKYGSIVHFSPDRMDNVARWFQKYGKWTLTFGYFLPGIRHLIAIVAGSSRLKFPEFALFAYLGALTWATTFILLGYYVGEDWELVLGKIHGYLIPAMVVFIVFPAIFLFFRNRNRHRKNRD